MPIEPGVVRNESLERLLRSINNHVLQDVWIGRRRALAISVIACGLGISAGFGAAHAIRQAHWVAGVAHLLLTALAMVSVIAAHRARYAWCCAAAYFGGVSTVAGLGAFWWYHTEHPGPSVLHAALSTVVAAGLTANWIALAITPVHDSQPDMRASASGPTAR